MELQTLYIVETGPEYDIFRRREASGRMEVFRTITGEGEIILKDGGSKTLTAGSLIAVRTRELLRYRCTGKRWFFLWFSFFYTGELPFCVGSLYPVPERGQDLQTARGLLGQLNSVRPDERAAASAEFLSLLYRWRQRSGGTSGTGPEDTFARLTAVLKGSFSSRMTVPGMAAFCGMSERSFRQKFRRWSGESPLRYYRRITAEAAASFLEYSAETMLAVSERFGYSSPFHMCTEFKKFFGRSPKYFRNTAVPRRSIP